MTSTTSVVPQTLSYYAQLAQLSRSRTTPALEDRSAWTTESMVKGVLQELQLAQVFDLELELLQRTQAELKQDWRLVEVFDVPHDSDESCSVHLLLSDGSPVLAFFAMGDRSDYSDGVRVLDIEWARGMARHLVSLMLDQQLERLSGDAPLAKSVDEQARDFWREVRYLCAVTPQVFYVDSPKWACGFSHLFKDHDARLLLKGELHRIESFDRFVNDKPSWAVESDRQDALFRLANGHRVIADASQVLFYLGTDPEASQPEFERALSQVLAPSCWHASQTRLSRTHDRVLTFTQHKQNQLQPKLVVLAFENAAAAQQASAALAQGEGLLNQDHPQVRAVADALDLQHCTFA